MCLQACTLPLRHDRMGGGDAWEDALTELMLDLFTALLVSVLSVLLLLVLFALAALALCTLCAPVQPTTLLLFY